eukprot:sb/3477465/
MRIDVPKEGISRVTPDWWITFDEHYQIMAGYVCIDNFVPTDIAKGLLYRNLLFIYIKPQLGLDAMDDIGKSLDKMAKRFEKELDGIRDETSEDFESLLSSKCHGFETL